MDRTDETVEYKSYMLRLWRANRRDPEAWRASLESPLTGERKGFASLRALVAYLEKQIGVRLLPPAQDSGIETKGDKP